MIATARVLDNPEEMEKYFAIIEEHGQEEGFNLGLYDKPPKAIFAKSEFLFRISEVQTAWLFNESITGEKLINIKARKDGVWTLYYDEQLWNKLKEHFKE